MGAQLKTSKRPKKSGRRRTDADVHGLKGPLSFRMAIAIAMTNAAYLAIERGDLCPIG